MSEPSAETSVERQTFSKNSVLNRSNVYEIEEDEDQIRGGREYRPMPSIKEENFENVSDTTASVSGDDVVYVGVGKGGSSLDALSWALRNAVNSSSTLVSLVHVFPETHFIPYPLGRLPKAQASPEQVESYMAQERGKTRELLHKFTTACSAANVKVDTVLIESDWVAKAILDLIPILNIRKLVLGISKSNERKMRMKRGNGIAEQILKSTVAETCDVKVICEGKEVKIDELMYTKSPNQQQHSSDSLRNKDPSMDPFSWICFNKPKTN